jgi:hypothetical protein
MSEPERSAAKLGALGWAAACLLLGLVALFAYAPIFAIDFFWHLKLGEVIAKTGAIPRTDLFSAVHPERPYVQFQWLWELLAYGAHQSGGLHAVRLMQVAWMSASFALLGAASLRLFRAQAHAFFFCCLALVLFEDRFQARPSATVLGFVACMLPLWLKQPAVASWRRGLYVFFVSCLWSNLHGGESLLSVLCMGALAVGAYLERHLSGEQDAGRVRSALTSLAAAALGMLVSPTLIEGLRDWTWSIQPQLASGNREWRPTYTMLENGFTSSFVLIALAPSLVSLVYLIEQRRQLARRPAGAPPPFAEWLLCAGLLVLAQQAVRNAFLCLVPLAFMLRRCAPAHGERTRKLLALAALCLLLAAFHDHVVEGYGGVDEAIALIGEDLAPQTFPVETADFMREANIEGGVLNDGRWGGYLIWRLWPRTHVFVDSRHDLTPAMWPVFLAAHSPGSRAAAMEQAYRHWGIALSLFRGPTFALVRPPLTWQLLFKAGDQELYQRLDAPNAALNMQRAQRWLAARAPQPGADLTQLALQVGAQRWLRAPYQIQREHKARELLRSRLAEDVQRGLSLQAELLFDAGRYAQALPLLEGLLARTPGDTKAAYKALLAALATGDQLAAQRWLPVLRQRRAQLSGPQRDRLRAIEQAMAAR